MSQFKYKEDEIIKDLLTHIKSTYSEHYTFEGGQQALDIFHTISPDLAKHYSLANALKYLLRYGKKEGKNYKDLMKALHCIILLAYFEHKKDEANNTN